MAKVYFENGLTADENRCLQLLSDAWGVFCELPVQHPNEGAEFTAAIHQLQGLLATRALRRLFPAGWPTYQVGEIGRHLQKEGL